MAYTGIDKEIYDTGVHFRPLQKYTQQQWTAPEIMGQNTNAGITATGAANPYKWPYPEGGGEYDRGISGTQITKRPLGLSPGALGGKLPGFGNWAKRTLGDVQNLYSKLPTPTNILKKIATTGIDKYKDWRAKQEEEEEEKAQIYRDRINEKIIKTGIFNKTYIPTVGGGGQDIIPPGDDGYDRGTFIGDHPDAPTKTPEQGGWHPGVGGQPSTTSTTSSTDHGGDWHPGVKEGGRIGYERGRVVNPGGYNGVIDRNIANLQAALKYSDLTAEERAQVEADLQMSLEAKGGWEDKLLSGEPVSKDAGKFWEGQAQGGRIGYRNGEFVDEDINVEGPGFDVNENLMASDPNAMDSLNEMSMQLFGKGVHELSEEEYQMLIDMANDQAAPEQDQGLASLV